MDRAAGAGVRANDRADHMDCDVSRLRDPVLQHLLELFGRFQRVAMDDHDLLAGGILDILGDVIHDGLHGLLLPLHLAEGFQLSGLGEGEDGLDVEHGADNGACG